MRGRNRSLRSVLNHGTITGTDNCPFPTQTACVPLEQIQTTHAVFFMNSKEIKEVVLLLNTSQASKNIDNLKNKLEETRRLKEEAFNKGDDKAFKKLGQEEKNRTPVKPDYIEVFYLPPTVDSQSKPTCRPALHVRFEIEQHCTTAPYGRFSIETYLQTCTPCPIRNRTALHHCTLRSIRNRNLLADLHPTSDSKSNDITPLHPTIDSQSKPTCRPAPHVRFEIERHGTRR